MRKKADDKSKVSWGIFVEKQNIFILVCATGGLSTKTSTFMAAQMARYQMTSVSMLKLVWAFPAKSKTKQKKQDYMHESLELQVCAFMGPIFVLQKRMLGKQSIFISRNGTSIRSRNDLCTDYISACLPKLNKIFRCRQNVGESESVIETYWQQRLWTFNHTVFLAVWSIEASPESRSIKIVYLKKHLSYANNILLALENIGLPFIKTMLKVTNVAVQIHSQSATLILSTTIESTCWRVFFSRQLFS